MARRSNGGHRALRWSRGASKSSEPHLHQARDAPAEGGPRRGLALVYLEGR